MPSQRQRIESSWSKGNAVSPLKTPGKKKAQTPRVWEGGVFNKLISYLFLGAPREVKTEAAGELGWAGLEPATNAFKGRSFT